MPFKVWHLFIYFTIYVLFILLMVYNTTNEKLSVLVDTLYMWCSLNSFLVCISIFLLKIILILRGGTGGWALLELTDTLVIKVPA